MRRTIHAIAVGAAMMCCAPRACLAGPVDADQDDALDRAEPAPLVERSAAPTDLPLPADDDPPFVWMSDVSPLPSPYLRSAIESPILPPSASATAIPLPPAIWTGLGSLVGLGAISYLKRARRRRRG